MFDRALAHGGPPALHPEVDWAAWIERWEPAYLWHSTAFQVANQVTLISQRRCRVAGEERQDERGRYWVWRVTLVASTRMPGDHPSPECTTTRVAVHETCDGCTCACHIEGV